MTALGGLVVTTAVLAAGAASLPSLLVPASRARPVPDWLAGPLAGLGPRLHEGEYALLALGLLVLYVVAVACASSLPAGGTLATIGALHGILLLAPPLLSPDVFGYLGYARLEVLHGLNPYAVGPDALGDADPVAPFLRHGATPSPYGPLFTIASLPVAKLTVPAGLWAFKAATGVAALGCLGLLWSCARALGQAPVPVLALVGLNPLWLIEAVGGAHNDLFMVLFLLLAVRLALAQRERLSAAALITAVGVKATAGITLPFLVLGARRRGPPVLGVGITGVALLGISLLALGPEATGYLETLAGHAARVSESSGPSTVAHLLGLNTVTPALRGAATALLAASAVLLAWRVRRDTDWLTAAGWAMLALLLTMTWLLPLAALARSRALTIASLLLTAHLVVTRLALHAYG